MPKQVPLTPEDIDWLRQNHGRVSYLDMARRYNVCVDTLKRILMRHDIAFFPAAKYATSQTSQTSTWKRPCMDCRDDTPRPRGWYYCRPCRLKRGYLNDE